MHSSNEPALVAQNDDLETISSIFIVVVIFIIVFICSKAVPAIRHVMSRKLCLFLLIIFPKSFNFFRHTNATKQPIIGVPTVMRG
jgi:hypothetical protein